MQQRTQSTRQCSVDGCTDMPHGLGMCRLHYRQSQPRRPDRLEQGTCDFCGATYMRSAYGGYKNVYGKGCSQLCRTRLQHGWSEQLPPDHWALIYGATCEWVAPESKQTIYQSRRCDECNVVIVQPSYQSRALYCSERCRDRIHRRRRRAREHNAPGEFRYVEVMRVYLKQGKVCAYCEQPIVGLPDPEHVLPLSRGGRNDMTNIVAACRACNTDKGDLTLTEWAVDRVRRGLGPVRTLLPRDTFAHVMHESPTVPAWRHREVA